MNAPIVIPLEDRALMHRVLRELVYHLLSGNELRGPWGEHGGHHEMRLRVYILRGLVEVLEAVGWEVSDGSGTLKVTPAATHALTYAVYDTAISDEDQVDEADDLAVLKRYARIAGADPDPRVNSGAAVLAARKAG